MTPSPSTLGVARPGVLTVASAASAASAATLARVAAPRVMRSAGDSCRPRPDAHNLTLSVLNRLTRFGIIDTRQQKRLVDDLMKRLQIKASSPKAAASSLSSGERAENRIGEMARL